MEKWVVQAAVKTEAPELVESALENPVRELRLYRLRCSHAANGLSHYYMYGDLQPEETVL